MSYHTQLMNEVSRLQEKFVGKTLEACVPLATAGGFELQSSSDELHELICNPSDDPDDSLELLLGKTISEVFSRGVGQDIEIRATSGEVAVLELHFEQEDHHCKHC